MSKYKYEAPEFSAFVSTWRTYNERGAHGKWFNLGDYESKREFIAAAEQYAKNELNDNDPELAFLDHDSNVYCNGFITEYGVSEQVWEILNGDIEAHQLEILDLYLRLFGHNKSLSFTEELERAESLYIGHYDSPEAFAQEWLENEEGELLDSLPSIIVSNIDYKGVYADLIDSYHYIEGHYFHVA